MPTTREMAPTVLVPGALLWVFFTHFCPELGIGVNIKVVGMEVSFPLSLV